MKRLRLTDPARKDLDDIWLSIAEDMSGQRIESSTRLLSR